MEESFEDFRRRIQKANNPRPNKTLPKKTGIKEAFKYEKESGWKILKKGVNDHVYSKIIMTMGEKIAQALVEGHEVVLPCNMGSLAIRMIPTRHKVDWNATMKFWYENKDMMKRKFLVKTKRLYEPLFDYKPNKRGYFKNSSMMRFRPNRVLAKQIRDEIEAGRAYEFVN